MSERATPETCQNCARLQRYAETAWNRGHAMGMKANEDIARQATEALRAEKAAHADTNAMLTASLMDAESQRDALADALRELRFLAGAYASDDGVWPPLLERTDALLAELEAKP